MEHRLRSPSCKKCLKGRMILQQFYNGFTTSKCDKCDYVLNRNDSYTKPKKK